jgi:hypothetical protein
MKYLILCLTFFLVGCNVSPLSPNNRIKNNGDIQELKNNQNGLMLDLIDIEQKQKLIMEKLETLQQGFINQNNKNFGVQIFHGEGGLILGAFIASMCVFLVIYYKRTADKNKKTAELLAQQIKNEDNEYLNEKIYLSALDTKVEKEIYELMNQ